MSNTYQVITKFEFEEALKSYGLGKFILYENPENNYKEYVYSLQLQAGLILRIFSSVDIKTGSSRSVGTDAIRIVPVAFVKKKTSYWKYLKKVEKRTNRTTNWKENLYQNLLRVITNISDGYKAGKCGHILVKRSSRFGEFWGCINFPSCRHKENLA